MSADARHRRADARARARCVRVAIVAVVLVALGGAGGVGLAVPRRRAVARRDRQGARRAARRAPTSTRNLGVTACEIGVATADRRRARARRRHRARRQPLPVAAPSRRCCSTSARRRRSFLPGDDHVVRRRRGLEDRDGRGVVLLPDRDQRRRRHARRSTRADPRRAELSRVDRGRWSPRSTCRRCAQPIVNGVRLGLGVAIIGTLLAETKLSNRGLGYLIIQAYALFDMPRMYALLIVLFVLAIGANALIGRLGARTPHDVDHADNRATMPALPATATSTTAARGTSRSPGARATTFNPGTGAALGDVADRRRRRRRRRGRRRAARLSRVARRRCRSSARASCARSPQLLREHADELALIDAANCGNPVREMAGDARDRRRAARFLRRPRHRDRRARRSRWAPTSSTSRCASRVGVVARIMPFNHPFMFAAGKSAAPLAAGNAVIVKPPDQAPLSALRLAELRRRPAAAGRVQRRARRSRRPAPRWRRTGRGDGRDHRQRRRRAAR